MFGDFHLIYMLGTGGWEESGDRSFLWRGQWSRVEVFSEVVKVEGVRGRREGRGATNNSTLTCCVCWGSTGDVGTITWLS